MSDAALKEAESLVGKKNIYTCECGHHVVTVDRDDGVTPFTVRCMAVGCGGVMQSSMYRVFDQRIRADYEWRKPTAIEGLSRGERMRVEKGGLLLYRKSDGRRL